MSEEPDVDLGGFVGRDPIGYEGSEWNLYEYVDGKPTFYMDSLGFGTDWGGPGNSGVVIGPGKPSEEHVVESTKLEKLLSQYCCCPESNKIDWIPVGNVGGTLTAPLSNWWASSIKADLPQGRVLRNATTADVKQVYEDPCTRTIYIIAHGTDIGRKGGWPSGKKKRPISGKKPAHPGVVVSGMDWDATPGVELSDTYIFPTSFSRWQKSPCLEKIVLHSCYQGAGERKKAWKEGTGVDVDAPQGSEHPGIGLLLQWPVW